MGITDKVHERVGIAVMLFIRIREMLGSNLGQDINNADLGFPWFYSLTPGKLRDNALTRQ
jgi:hypothetical protein